jgi:hypothetical protein
MNWKWLPSVRPSMLRTSSPRDCWLSVNASAELLSGDGTVAAILEGTRRRLVIELSERELIEDYAPIRTAIESLGPRCSLAVDDAGAGFASLRHILEVRPASRARPASSMTGPPDEAHSPGTRGGCAGRQWKVRAVLHGSSDRPGGILETGSSADLLCDVRMARPRRLVPGARRKVPQHLDVADAVRPRIVPPHHS